jgi:4-carboxymuconolactone decarboxylase
MMGRVRLHGQIGRRPTRLEVSVGRFRRMLLARKGGLALDYTEQLRRLAINDANFARDCGGGASAGSGDLDARTLALVRLAALVAVGGAVSSYGAQADAAVDAGATAAEIVDVLVGVVPIVGLPRVVAAAPKVATALGYDIDKALE